MFDDGFDEIEDWILKWVLDNMHIVTTPDGKKMVRVTPDESEHVQVYEYNEELEMEQIDLDDRTMIIVSGIRNDTRPSVRVKGSRVTVNAAGLEPMKFQLPHAVDTSQVHVSFRNGVLEITLPYAPNDTHASDEVELRPE